LIVTGDVLPERILEAARRHFGEWPAGPDPFADRPIPLIPRRVASSAVLVVADVLDVTIVVALQGPGARADPDATYAADVLFDVFNDPASAFQQRLVDSGPFRSIAGGYRTLAHTGPIEFRGKTTPQNAQQATMALLTELDHLDRLDGVTDEDLAIAKKRRQVGAALAAERTATLAPGLAQWWSATGMDYYLTYHDRMALQTAEDLRVFARSYIVQHPRVIGVLGAPAIVDQLAAWLRQGVRPPSP
jgi:predicted Zn-dependent peptidase